MDLPGTSAFVTICTGQSIGFHKHLQNVFLRAFLVCFGPHNAKDGGLSALVVTSARQPANAPRPGAV
jgi:hypothetical protein